MRLQLAKRLLKNGRTADEIVELTDLTAEQVRTLFKKGKKS
jgi:hypothetical protein